MRVEKISDHEKDFDQNGIDGDGKAFRLTPSSIAIPNENSNMDYVLAKPKNGDESYYYADAQEKDQIVLHYTMGYLKGDFAQLTRSDNHVSVAFVIGRNGTIYNLFASRFWSYHLGRGAVGGNATRSKKTGKSIGERPIPTHITTELANYLTAIPEGQKGLFPDTFTSKKWQKIRERAGLKNQKFHDLRKTFGSALAQRGISTSVTQRLLEHSTPLLTNDIYINVDPVLRQAVDRLPVEEWL